MISIQTAMLVALGFFIASLLWLLLASAFWSRAVRLTTQRLKRSLPVSEAEIRADRDRLRAEHAVRVHKLEARVEQVSLERARQLIEINRRDATISRLETDIVALRADLEEAQNARRVLEQTVVDRLPKVEARLSETKRLLSNRDREIAELAQDAKRHKQALEEASSINAQKTAQIERLNSALTTRGGRSRRGQGENVPESGVSLQVEIEALRSKTRDQAALIDRLQRMLGHGYASPPSSAEALSPGDAGRASEVLSNAEATLGSAYTSATSAMAASQNEKDREISSLKAQTEDQAGEIARLKAALAALEQTGARDGPKDTKLALNARVASAEAQAERQAATIGRLRAELAAANERLARQAARFMDEMRTIGGGTGTGLARRTHREGGRRKLVERVAHVRPTLADVKVPGPRAEPETANGTEVPTGNGREPGPEETVVSAAQADTPPAPESAAPEMPQTAAIPGQRRRLRLLDRITSLSKT